MYNLSSKNSLTGLIEIGLDSTQDGIYDNWTVTTNSSEPYPVQYKTVDTNNDKEPDLFSMWVARTNARDFESSPIFSYQQVTSNPGSDSSHYRTQIVLGGKESLERSYQYDDIDRDGRLDTRRVTVGEDSKESYIYFEDNWVMIEAIARPYVVILRGGQAYDMQFKNGAWAIVRASKA